MSNQQERFSERFDMGWLTCGIESEGHITLAWGRYSKGSCFQIVPRIAIANMVEKYILNVQRISHHLGVGCYIEFDGGRGKRTPMYRISWQGFKRAKRILEVILPGLITKRDRAQEVLSFIKRREAVKSNVPYSQEDINSFLRVRKINGTKNPLPSHISEKILRDYTLNTDLVKI